MESIGACNENGYLCLLLIIFKFRCCSGSSPRNKDTAIQINSLSRSHATIISSPIDLCSIFLLLLLHLRQHTLTHSSPSSSSPYTEEIRKIYFFPFCFLISFKWWCTWMLRSTHERSKAATKVEEDRESNRKIYIYSLCDCACAQAQALTATERI